jgi:site-specific recombinase XerD
MPYEAYVAILLIQLVNGARIGEAIRAFKMFVETGQREFQLWAEKKGNMKFFIIPNIIKNRPSYRSVLTISDYDLKARIRMFTKKYLKCSTHSLRYAMISFLTKNGTDPAIVAKITGHKKLDRIVQYTQLKDAVEIQRKLAS